jgi:hypothetical protein
MPMSKIIPHHVDFRLRLPAKIDRALRNRAAERWMDRNTYVRELIRQNVLSRRDDGPQATKLR